ncbi:hypothetical protein AVEN_138309-1 [Araneus ventricosus]|uniref:Speckle-type POZ protein n=1 Tax=Araneus ventricosus TaxID=182803 RepID=A0A4Y2G6D6_ARAVE|nr:hypothetical protein AVEN_138309-1 [Araneus ventricosus]
MTEENVNKTEEPKETILTWRIENAHLCWQKTGEELVSPTFAIDWLNESSWNLCFYPRGIQGEDSYTSYFIAQEKKNDTVANTGAKFELYLLAADGSKVLPENPQGFLSMKKHGMWGYSRFISWKTLMDENGSRYLPDETLTLCCRIWCEYERDMEKKKELVKLKAFARTRIRKEDIFQQMAIDLDESRNQKIGELKPILQECPIAKFIATLGETSNHKSLTIGIDVKKNEKIKSAVCELVLVDEERKALFWKNKYAWHEIIERENMVLSSHFPKNSEQYVPEETFAEKCLYLACQFVFTTGSTTQKIEKDDYGNNLDRFFEQRLSNSSGVKQEPSCLTASEALKSLFYDPLFHDATIKGRTAEFKVHEMVLSPRSEVFKKLLSERDRNTNLVQINNEDDDTLQKVIYFLYTDTIPDMHWEVAKKLYKAAIKYKIELLKEKCCTFIKKNLSSSNVSDIVVLTKNEKDDELKEYVTNFIIKNESDVFNSVEWSIFSKSNSVLAGEYMVAKYKMK